LRCAGEKSLEIRLLVAEDKPEGLGKKFAIAEQLISNQQALMQKRAEYEAPLESKMKLMEDWIHSLDDESVRWKRQVDQANEMINKDTVLIPTILNTMDEKKNVQELWEAMYNHQEHRGKWPCSPLAILGPF
jgi:hypothetical protein